MFSKIDHRPAYHQLKINNTEEIPNMIFQTTYGHNEFFMKFSGLTNALILMDLMNSVQPLS